MAKKTEDALQEIEDLIERTRIQDAEDRIRALLITMGDEELRLWEFDIRNTLKQFFPKRRKVLTAALDKKLMKTAILKGSDQETFKNEQKQLQIEDVGAEFAESLAVLSAQHIFQWSTFYRDQLSAFFDRFLAAAEDGGPIEKIESTIHSEISKHANEIFRKGFEYLGGQSESFPRYAINKSLSGLQRFLEVPIELYSTKTSSVRSPRAAHVLRKVNSAFVSGILQGYASLELGNQMGAQILPSFPRSWAHYMIFLTEVELKGLLSKLEPGNFKDGVESSFLPLVKAIDQIAAGEPDYVPLPVLGQFIWESRRFEASLKPPLEAEGSQFIEIVVFLDTSFVSLMNINETLNRDVSLIISPLKADLQGIVSTNDRASQILVLVSQNLIGSEQITRRIIDILNYAVYRRRSIRAGSAPLTYNFAREFPIQNPNLTKYFHVYRSSVRELLRAFERRNGVRLWCSVRRSGKTTACFDLSTTTGTSVIMSQTCGTSTLPDATIMYDEISSAIEKGRQLSRKFFHDLVLRCAMDRKNTGERYVLVLDEYETLFGRLKSAAIRDNELRYTVVQPLLNQMVEFASNNLLVFIGQQPNAHFILMDQNQLSPYVEQDPFPLFQHRPGSVTGEFALLIKKVLTERVSFDGDFADAVYKETAGHPFLTVKILVALVDWLIERKRAIKNLHLTGGDYKEFSKKRLVPRKISLSPEYVFFREAITEAMGSFGRKTDPWLYSIYSVMHDIVGAHPTKLSVSSSEFEKIVKRLGVEEFGFSADRLLATGTQANFLKEDNGQVGFKITLLGRIAGICHGRLGA